jgi:hypothetical protein
MNKVAQVLDKYGQIIPYRTYLRFPHLRGHKSMVFYIPLACGLFFANVIPTSGYFIPAMNNTRMGNIYGFFISIEWLRLAKIQVSP